MAAQGQVPTVASQEGTGATAEATTVEEASGIDPVTVVEALEGVGTGDPRTAAGSGDPRTTEAAGAADLGTAEAGADEAVQEEDVQAQAFMRKCAGCHTLGGGALTGPDLRTASTWPRNNLHDAVKRMEKNVGPLTEDEANLFTDFIASPDAAERIAREREQMALRMMAQLEPGSPSVGGALFHGSRPFLNGGLACGACHQAAGHGGSLAVALEDAFTRIGEMPLIATCENPGYPLMRAIYANTPITKQEAVHVVKYLETVAGAPRAAGTYPVHLLGLIAAGILFVSVRKVGHRQPHGTRARLVAESKRRRKQGLA